MAKKHNYYTAFEDWFEDMEKFLAHPEDRKIVESMTERLSNSDIELVRYIQDYMESTMVFPSNPEYLCKRIVEVNPGLTYIINQDSNDGFFEV